MLNSLLSVIGIQASVDTEKKSITSNITIKCDTSRLPEVFREKFRLGDYSINESDGDIRISPLDIDSEYRKTILDAIGEEKEFFNFSKRKKKILELWENFTLHSDTKTVIYLKVGGKTYFYPDLFERLIIAKNGIIEKDIRHGYRSILFSDFQEKKGWTSCIKDDRNIHEELQSRIDLSKEFQNGALKIFVYHKLCHSLTSLYYDRHDDEVASINKKRAFAIRAKDTILWGSVCGIGVLLTNILGDIPLVGSLLNLGVTFAGCMTLYKGYQLLCPKNIKATINTYLGEKIGSKIPI
jgi:hypothetical protein